MSLRREDESRGRVSPARRPTEPDVDEAAAGHPGSPTRPLSAAGLLHLQRTAGNAAARRLVAATAHTVQRDDEPTAEELAAATRIQSAIRGARVREQVRVRTEAPGIVGVRVRNTDPAALGDLTGSPLASIREDLTGTTEYHHLRVAGGATQGAVLGPGPGQPGERAASLAAGLPHGTAVINGGYFAHTPTIRSEEGWQPQPADPDIDAYSAAVMKNEELRPVGPAGMGRPVGPTSHRDDALPIPSEYAQDYGALTIDGRVGLSSGPLLTRAGVPRALPDDDRFRYRLTVDGDREENPRNQQAGVLTHAGDPNTRAALSTRGNDAVMHAVVDPTMALGAGVTMAQWQKMTRAGAGDDPSLSTLNLDGGGSVYLGVTGPGGVRVVAKGQRPSETVERPVGNIIASRPRDEEQH